MFLITSDIMDIIDTGTISIINGNGRQVSVGSY